MDRPNFVIVLTDDLGFGDVGCYGAQDIPTPNLDRMAAEGTRFTNFCVGAPTCTPSRAALLTGCYPQRVGLPAILLPWSREGLGAGERTIADVLRTRGYATACYGKWHLGHHPEFLPTRHGFDEYFGLPYSNDMWLNHPIPGRAERMLELPLYRDEEIVELNPDQSRLTTLYTEKAVDFIGRNRDRPFFLYLPHSMPHVPLHVSDRFKGKSGRGLYGDVIMEIDWSLGRILETLRELELDGKTLVLFTSDNGPWLEYGDHGGSAGPLREGKWTTFEGGQRVPALARWPEHVPAGRECGELVSAMDLLPTFAALAGADLPSHPIDGRDIRPVLSGGPGGESPRRIFLHYRGFALEAARDSRWKLHFPHTYKQLVIPGSGGIPGTSRTGTVGLELYDLGADIGERRNVAAEHPGQVRRLLDLAAEAHRALMACRRMPGQVEMDGVVAGGRLFRSGVSAGALETAPGEGGRERLRWLQAPRGARLSLGLAVPATAEYEVSLRAGGAGRFRLTLDGRVIGELDAGPGGLGDSPLLIGLIAMPVGMRRLVFEVVSVGPPETAALDLEYVRIELPH